MDNSGYSIPYFIFIFPSVFLISSLVWICLYKGIFYALATLSMVFTLDLVQMKGSCSLWTLILHNNLGLQLYTQMLYFTCSWSVFACITDLCWQLLSVHFVCSNQVIISNNLFQRFNLILCFKFCISRHGWGRESNWIGQK